MTFMGFICIIIIMNNYIPTILRKVVRLMKKVLSSVLILVLVFAALFAMTGCQTEQKDIYAIANSSPATQITTSVQYEFEDEIIAAWYDILVDDETNNAIVEYSYGRYLSIDEGAATGGDFLEESEGVIYYYNGVYYDKLGDTVSDPWVSAAADAEFKFNLVESLLISPVVSEDNTKLTATMTAENCKTMFGFDFDAEGEIDLEVLTNGVNLTDVNISCTTTSGATLVIETTYAPRSEELDFSLITGEEEE